MSKKERIKLEIDILKSLILAFIAAIFGIFGFTLMNYQKINLLQGIGILIGLILLFWIVYITTKKIIKNLNKIEELE